jgi:hypothetical protein
MAPRPATSPTTRRSSPAPPGASAGWRSSASWSGDGVVLRHSRPYHPQTCGKVERFHQTLKKWLEKQPKATSITALQFQLDTFRLYYNTYRPHRALGRKPPLFAYEARPKAVPSAGPLALAHYRTRRDVVDKAGTVTLRHNSRLHHIGIGRRWAGTAVLVLVQELEIRVITGEGELIRELVLDPTRDYQPLSGLG